MSLWRVLSIRVDGNPVDGWENGELSELDYLSIRDDWKDARIIEALVNADHLNKNALAMFEAGELNIESDHGYEIGEIEQAWAHTADIVDEGEDAYLAAGYAPAMTAAEVAEAEDNGYTADAYELVSAHRPFLRLEPAFDEGEAVPFWRDIVAVDQGHAPPTGLPKRLRALVELRAVQGVCADDLRLRPILRGSPAGVPFGALRDLDPLRRPTERLVRVRLLERARAAHLAQLRARA